MRASSRLVMPHSLALAMRKVWQPLGGLVRAICQCDRHRLLGAAAVEVDAHPLAGLVVADRGSHVLGPVYRRAVDSPDHVPARDQSLALPVAAVDARLGRRPAG